MKVKIGDTVYNSNEQPIMLVLDDKEKEDISNMAEDCDQYCCYVSSPYWVRNNFYRLKRWMSEI